MTLKYKKVSLATIDDFNSFCSKNPNIKYIDDIIQLYQKENSLSFSF